MLKSNQIVCFVAMIWSVSQLMSCSQFHTANIDNKENVVLLDDIKSLQLILDGLTSVHDTLDWPDIWFFEDDAELGAHPNSTNLVKERRNYAVASKYMKYYYYVWILWQGKKIDQEQKAYLLYRNKAKLYDYQSLDLHPFRYKKRMPPHDEIIELHEKCKSWLAIAIKYGSQEATRKQPFLLPQELQWVEF